MLRSMLRGLWERLASTRAEIAGTERMLERYFQASEDGDLSPGSSIVPAAFADTGPTRH